MPAREIELNMIHAHTRDSFAWLDANEIDLLCAGFASVTAAGDIPGHYEFLRWRREGLVLLTNLPERRLPAPSVIPGPLPSRIVPAACARRVPRGQGSADAAMDAVSEGDVKLGADPGEIERFAIGPDVLVPVGRAQDGKHGLALADAPGTEVNVPGGDPGQPVPRSHPAARSAGRAGGTVGGPSSPGSGS